MTVDQIRKDKHLVMFGANSITIKDRSTGKTAGVIRNARRLSGATRNPRQDFDAIQALKRAGLDWRAVSLDRLVFCDGVLYLFIDRRHDEVRNSNPALYRVDNTDGRLDARIEADDALVKSATAAGIPCIEYLPHRPEDGHSYR